VTVYVDVSSAVHAKAGIGRYAESLVRALIARQRGRYAVFYNQGRRAKPLEGLGTIPTRTVRAGYKPWRMAVWLGHLAQIGFDSLVPDAELFHATEHLLLPLKEVPTVLTVHDMIFQMFPEHQKRLNYWYLNATMPIYCRRADAIITVSESSKRDIVTSYGLDAGKIRVVYEAAAPEFTPASTSAIEGVRRRYGLPEQYLLHVGTIEPRKNLARLTEALQKLRDAGLRIPLVVVGGKGWLYQDFFERLEGLPVADSVLFPGYVPANDLPTVYCAARLAIMASVYEGFGLPLLEAMACGTPVVSSNSSSLPEVGGDAALYFDPYDIDAMAGAIHSAWTDSELREHLKQLGLVRSSEFSWERAAQETTSVYDAVLRAHPTSAGGR
jgi:glycosyltransferase involved in cell wall biosynthesis